MRKTLSAINQVILLCKDIHKTTAIYSQAIGLKVTLQTPQLVELKDANHFTMLLKKANKAYQLSKGYSPILCFKVDDFEMANKKAMAYCLMAEGEVMESERGKMRTFMGIDGEMICIHSLAELDTTQDDNTQSIEQLEIRQLLDKIKL